MKKIVSYDLHGVTDESVYTNVRKDIEKTYPKSVYILNTTYVFYTSDDMDTVFRKLKAIFSKYLNEDYFEFFTSKISDHKGWLRESKWKEFNDKLKSTYYF